MSREKERGRRLGRVIAKVVIILLLSLLGITLLAMSGTIPYNSIVINGLSYALVSLTMLLVGMVLAVRCKLNASSLGIGKWSMMKKSVKNEQEKK